MNTHANKTEEKKNQSVANGVYNVQSGGESAFQFVDNRPKSVAQLITYKQQEYSVPLENISTFREVANTDLASLAGEGQPRDVSRDKKMLNIIAKSDQNIESKEQLKSIIDPTGKDYQTSIENELKDIRPEVIIINNAANVAKTKTFLTQENNFDREEASLSKIAIDSEMNKVIGSAKKIDKIVQWRKIDGIPKNANTVKNTASIITGYFENDGSISNKSEIAFPKKVAVIKSSSDSIINTASSIEPELKQSGDEQYLRGGVGNKADVAGGSHLIIGKKLDTFKLEGDQDKSSGILKASVWSGGVNDAFIEGGIDDRKEFRLISDVPQNIQKVLRDGDFEGFVELAQQWGQREKAKEVDARAKPVKDVEPVWWAIWDTRKEALTTLSKELIKLMRNGYVLE